MNIFEAIILGIVEGITEFLPISSTGHLTVTEKLMGLQIDSPDVTAFTAVIQMGAILAAVYYFRGDIWRLLSAWAKGLFNSTNRGSSDYKMGWAVIIGSAPIGIIGLLFKDQIEQDLRSLWIVAIGLIVWSFVMLWADRSKTPRHEKDITWRDTLIIGLTQCLALFPGVSRSGATISAGLLRGIDRVAATRMSFFLGIPALLAAGALQAVTQASNISGGVGWPSTIVATAISFVVGYASIAWLIKFVSNHNFTVFIAYRIVLGLIIAGLLATGIISST